MIIHSIPKNQIVPDPNVKPSTSVPGAKRVVEQISSNQSSQEEGGVRASKKSKVEKCRSPFHIIITKAETTMVSKSVKKKGKKSPV